MNYIWNSREKGRIYYLLEGGVNLYGYVHNNPVNKIDFLGLDEPGNGGGPDGTGDADTADTSTDTSTDPGSEIGMCTDPGSEIGMSTDPGSQFGMCSDPGIGFGNFGNITDASLGMCVDPSITNNFTSNVMHDLKCVAELALDITGKIGKTIGKTVMGLATLGRTGNPDPAVRALGEWETFLPDVESMSEEAQECKKH